MSELSKNQLAHIRGEVKRAVEWDLLPRHVRGRLFDEGRMRRQAQQMALIKYPHAPWMHEAFIRQYCDLYQAHYPKEGFHVEVTS